jgi:AcrR family transcriptional regulator
MVEAVEAGEQPRRVRMAPDDRERMILDAAVRFFARHGFDAQIRELAKAIGISQGLIYRYFRSKQALVERVYEHTFLQRWEPEWELILADRKRPLRERLERFYGSYLAAIDDPDWIRLVMHSGLDGNDLTRRYIETQVAGLLALIARECRASAAGGSGADVTQADIEAVWHLHSTFIYYLVRKHIFGVAVTDSPAMLVSVAVGSFLDGLRPRRGQARYRPEAPA